MSIHEQEDALWTEWQESYSEAEKKLFVMDGLCHNGVVNEAGTNSDTGNEEELWEKARRKIVFLMKDANGNGGEDYREWHWRNITAKFFRVIFNWLQGLSEITPDYTPLLENGSYLDPANQTVLKYPLAIVNVKKITGGAFVQNAALYEYAERDADFLRRQVRDILQPNIVVCGGGNSSVWEIAQRYIYPDLHFEKINSWCYYAQEQDLLLIDSFHPQARISDSLKIDKMMQKVADFIQKTKSAIFA